MKTWKHWSMKSVGMFIETLNNGTVWWWNHVTMIQCNYDTMVTWKYVLMESLETVSIYKIQMHKEAKNFMIIKDKAKG